MHTRDVNPQQQQTHRDGRVYLCATVSQTTVDGQPSSHWLNLSSQSFHLHQWALCLVKHTRYQFAGLGSGQCLLLSVKLKLCNVKLSKVGIQTYHGRLRNTTVWCQWGCYGVSGDAIINSCSVFSIYSRSVVTCWDQLGCRHIDWYRWNYVVMFHWICNWSDAIFLFRQFTQLDCTCWKQHQTQLSGITNTQFLWWQLLHAPLIVCSSVTSWYSSCQQYKWPIITACR